MQKVLRGLAVTVALSVSATCVTAADWSGALGVASDNVFRGVSQSRGNPTAAVNLNAASENWYAGLAVAGVRRRPDYASAAEITAYAGYAQRMGSDWNGGVALRHYDYPWGSPYRQRAYDELALSLDWRARLFVSASASPNTRLAPVHYYYLNPATNDAHLRSAGSDSAAFCYEFALHQPLPHGLTLNTGVGYYDLQREVGKKYVYWSAAVARSWQSWHAELGYIGTDHSARQVFGNNAGNRVVVSLLWLF